MFLFLSGIYGLYRVETLTKQLNNQVKIDCFDRSGDLAFRHQNETVVLIYTKLSKKEITVEQARISFIDAYSNALLEAGTAPECITR